MDNFQLFSDMILIFLIGWIDFDSFIETSYSTRRNHTFCWFQSHTATYTKIHTYTTHLSHTHVIHTFTTHLYIFVFHLGQNTLEALRERTIILNTPQFVITNCYLMSGIDSHYS